MADKSKQRLKLRNFPSISSVLEDVRLKPLMEKWSFPFVSAEVKSLAAEAKRNMKADGRTPSTEELVNAVIRSFEKTESDLLRSVINGTGVILHTNLGRAPVDDAVLNSLKVAVCGYSNLEFDINKNKRSKRGSVVGRFIAAVSGAEAGMIVNNNAASVYLIVANLAAGMEVVISRGQLVQIGGGFRIPEIIERTGAVMKEIGTTNKTTLADYKKAITGKTGLVLVVHKSNFVQKGFTEEPEPSRIAEIARQKKTSLCYDLGSGLLEAGHGATPSDEPDIASAVRTGADLVCFSGDKLLGGPQAGIIVGRRKLISSLLKDPLYRVVRPDKVTIGLMEGTLLKYAGGKEEVLSWKMARLPVNELKERAEKIVGAVDNSKLTAMEMNSSFGGGSLPEYQFESYGLKISGDGSRLSKELRDFKIPVITRTVSSGVMIDLRTVLPEQDNILIDAIKSCMS